MVLYIVAICSRYSVQRLVSLITTNSVGGTGIPMIETVS
jgi:hypothetical protein